MATSRGILLSVLQYLVRYVSFIFYVLIDHVSRYSLGVSARGRCLHVLSMGSTSTPRNLLTAN